MLISMFRVNVGGGSLYPTSAFSGSRLWLIMANKQKTNTYTVNTTDSLANKYQKPKQTQMQRFNA